MTNTDSVFSGSIPDVYDDFLVPMIFERFAADMASRVAQSEPRAVLEIGACICVFALALAPLLGPGSRFCASDLNGAMIDRAKRQQPDPGALEWHVADALDLPFEDQCFDAVCCQFGVMFFPDRVRGMAEARRVLRPGGRFVFNVWDRIEENVFADAVTKACATVFPDDPPRFMARIPHGYFDTARIGDDLNAAGCTD